MTTLTRISTGAWCRVLSITSIDMGVDMFFQLPALAKGMECDQFEEFHLVLGDGSRLEFEARIKATRQCSDSKHGLMQRKYRVIRCGVAKMFPAPSTNTPSE